MIWIKCSDKMPPLNETVLVTDGDRFDFAQLRMAHKDAKPDWYHIRINGDEVTHWHPLTHPYP